MSTFRIAAQLLLAWLALLAAQIGVGMVVRVNTPHVSNLVPWLLVSNVIVVVALATAGLRSDWRDWRLLCALFVVRAAIDMTNLLEGAVYLPNAGMDWPRIAIFSLASTAVSTLLWFLIMRSAPVPDSTANSPIPHRAFAPKLWRFALCAACYVVLYFVAGMIVFPYVRDFYATQHIPALGPLLAMQFFVRGPVFILACLLLLQMFRLPHYTGALAVGLAFTCLSGVAALIIPSAVFPDHVRWAHFCEVTSSNFVFGFVVGWMWGRAQGVRHLAHATA
jgi:hypothetical protein